MPKSIVYLTLFLVFMSFGSQLSAQDPGRSFYKEYKRTEGVVNLSLPGWLVWLGGGMAYNSVNDPEVKAMLKLGKKVKRLRLLHVEDGISIPQASIRGFDHQLVKSGYEELITVKADDVNVRIAGKIKGEKFRKLIVFVAEEDSLTLIQMKSNIKIKHIARLIKQLRKIEDQAEKKAEKKEKIPQA